MDNVYQIDPVEATYQKQVERARGNERDLEKYDPQGEASASLYKEAFEDRERMIKSINKAPKEYQDHFETAAGGEVGDVFERDAESGEVTGFTFDKEGDKALYGEDAVAETPVAPSADKGGDLVSEGGKKISGSSTTKSATDSTYESLVGNN